VYRTKGGTRVYPNPHALRHAAASMAVANGASLKLVQHMLGHRDIAMTGNTYAHLFPGSTDVADRMDSAWEARTAQREGTNVVPVSAR
jgi:site-specific recombinase XerD